MVNGVNEPNFLNKTTANDTAKKMAYQSYGMNFEAMLKEQFDKTKSLQFSKHAKERVEQRGIEVTNTLMDSLNDAVARAKLKGAKDIVIIGEKEAFIVNIPNNVIVTTISEKEMKENIFTNIDSAVIL